MKKSRSILTREKSLTEKAVENIRSRIIQGEFKLGQALSENLLADDLGVSKTPIREALLQLQADGLVDIKPQRGSYVFHLTIEEVEQLAELRQYVEAAGLELAVNRNREALISDLLQIVDKMEKAIKDNHRKNYRMLGSNFHRTFLDHCGNFYLRSVFNEFTLRIEALRGHLSANEKLKHKSVLEHRKIVELIIDGKVSAAQKALKKHILQTVPAYVEAIQKLGADT